MHHDGNEDESSRSRWPDEGPGDQQVNGTAGPANQVFDQDDYTPPVWDSWSDDPGNFPHSDESTQSWRMDDPAHHDPSHQDPAQDDLPTGVLPVAPIDVELEPGLVVADRYRLEEELAVRGEAHSWRAFDQKLSRPVMLHLLRADAQQNELVLNAARQSAIATDSRFLRVLDAINGEDVAVPGVGACVVSEFVPGMSVEDLLSSGPLSGVEAAWVTRELADALAPMHAKGLFHEQLNPDTVIVTATGNVKIAGFLIEEAMHPSEHHLYPDDDWAGKQEADVRALGQLLYAMLVCRWPAPHSQADRKHWGMSAAPMDGHGWLTPRQVRAGVSPALDVVCDQVLSQVPRTGAAPVTTAAQLNKALSRVLGTADASADLEHRVRYPTRPSEPSISVPAVARQPASTPTPAVAPAPVDPVTGHPLTGPPVSAVPPVPRPREGVPARPRPAPRHWLPVLVGLVALTLLGSLIAIGINSRDDKSTPGQSTSATAAPVSHPFAKVDDFDPAEDGGNDEENPDAVAKAWDKKPDTAWTTLRYIGNPKLGGLKPGVGLLVDLGQTVDVGRVTLELQGSPTGVQVLVPAEGADDGSAPAPMTSIKQWKAIATNGSAGEKATLTPSTVVKTRYLLVYLTSLPSVGGGGYRGGIAEIGVFDR